MTLKHFGKYLPFVGGINQWLVDSPPGPIMQSYKVFFHVYEQPVEQIVKLLMILEAMMLI